MVHSQVVLPIKSNNKIMKKIEIQQIPFHLTFEGYYWYSNASKPCVLDDETISASIFTQLPFIIEGNLYNKENQISINIKNIDGQYLITQADLMGLDEANLTLQTYIPHDLTESKGIPGICFS